MENKLVAKQKYMWKIINFNRETLNKYTEKKCMKSEQFEIMLGEFNKTKWNFVIYPKSRENCWRFAIHKVAVDQENFILKLSGAIQRADNTTINHRKFEIKSQDFKDGGDWGWHILNIEETFKEENKYVSNNMLTLIINIELHQLCSSVKRPRLDLNDWTAKYFNSKSLSDATIVCPDGKMIPVHRNILAGRSTVFEEMFATGKLEKKLNMIIIDDINYDTLLEFLRYVYTLETPNLKTFAPQLFICAEKYFLPHLKQLCVAELIDQLSHENVFENLQRAKSYNEQKLMKECMSYIDRNFTKLMKSEEWKNLDTDLILSIMLFMRESSKKFNLLISSL